jgi:hypothetical protein
MCFPLRMAFPVLVGIATLTVCSIGVRAELKIAKNSIADRVAAREVEMPHRGKVR